MAKSYQGSLTLEWYNKEKAIILQAPEAKKASDIPAPRLNWVNKEESLFYEISDPSTGSGQAEGRGLEPFWVDRNDIRVKEIRPLVFQKGYRAVATDKPGMLPGTEQTYKVEELKKEDATIPNMLIRGDNLLALNALVKMFEGKPDAEKVKCICIDPPYNTGSAFEHYDDNLEHSEWLTLMRDRLSILHKILRDDGSIWIFADDDESHYLKILCDDVLGRGNFIANVIWQKKYSPANDSLWFSDSHDHILVYAKSIDTLQLNKLPRSAKANSIYQNFDNDPRGEWASDNYTCNKNKDERPNLYYAITNPNTGETIWPKPTRVWAYEKATHLKHIQDNLIYWGKDGSNSVPRLKRFLSNLDKGLIPQTIWWWEEVGHTQDAKKEQIDLMTDDPFPTPKPEKLVEKILSISSAPSDIILDCFAGSGTTLAVAQKMGRRYIGVEIGKHADTHIIPRLQKVLSGEDPGGISQTKDWRHGGGAFQYFHVGPSIVDSVKGDFNWKLGVTALQEALLQTYDFAEMQSLDGATLGILRGKADVMAGICSLAAPGKGAEILTYFDFAALVEKARALKPRSIVFFTNRGIEVAEDEKPEGVEIIKVPQAIFAELEK